MAKKKTIDEATGLLTWLIAETVATKIMVEKFEDRLGKGNITNEHSAALETDVKNWEKYLTEKAEGCFKANARFRKKIMADGNVGRDTLYMYMYHWMGVQDNRVFSDTSAKSKTLYDVADKELKRYLETGEIR